MKIFDLMPRNMELSSPNYLQIFLVIVVVSQCFVIARSEGCGPPPGCSPCCVPKQETKGMVSVSSSAAASVKYPQAGQGPAQAYISSLSNAKADPKIPVTVNQPLVVNPAGPPPPLPPVPTTRPPTAPTTPGRKTGWNYKETATEYGPAKWHLLAPKCAGQSQSPIDIQTGATQGKPLTNPLTINIANPGLMGKLINNGKAIGFNVDIATSPVKLSGGILSQTPFTLRQFHFHFGCEGETGSEHTLDGERFDGELHLVFTNDKYPNARVAMQQPDGLAILAFFMKAGAADPNGALERITNQVENIKNPKQEISFPDGISLANMIPHLKEGLSNLRRFSYKGSLPTPPCFQSVQWIVFKRPIGLLPDRLKKWRQMNGEAGSRICGNYRPLQPLNGRVVSYFQPEVTGPSPTTPPGGKSSTPRRSTTRMPSSTRRKTTIAGSVGSSTRPPTTRRATTAAVSAAP